MQARQTSVTTSVGDDKIEVREATPSDYEGVMAISNNIYDGVDYLPDIYQSFMKNPGANYYVLLKNDKIVSVTSLFLFHSKFNKKNSILYLQPNTKLLTNYFKCYTELKYTYALKRKLIFTSKMHYVL